MDLNWVLETLPVGLWVARVPQGDVVYTNSEFSKILGVDAASGSGIDEAPRTYGIFDRAARPYPVERLPFSRVVETGLPVVVDDIVIHRPDGRRVDVRAFGFPAFDETKELKHVGVAFIDISAEAKAEFERDQTLARLALAVNHAPIVLWSTDRHGVITLSEGAGLAALGVKSGELVGASVFELYKDHPASTGYIRRGLNGESLAYTVQVGDVTFDTQLVPLRDAAGATIGVTALSHDVSQVRKLQATAIQNDRAIALGTLASSVAHEINNPLTYVLGHLTILGEELDTLDAAISGMNETRLRLSDVAARMREALEIARSGTERISTITRELGTFSRPSTDDYVAVNIVGAVKSALRLVGKEIEAQAHLQLDLRATAPVRGNTSRLVQVVLNLVVNAIQAMATRPPAANHIWISTRDEGPDVVIEVADNGQGVALEDRERIFEPFVTRKDLGTGLGLFVCRTIVESAGGRVLVDERPGGGARFRVVLPAATDLAHEEPPPGPEPTSELQAPGHVLIVDDDAAVANVLRRRLHAAGYDITVETDAVRALARLLAGERFDVIYCDLMMEGMTGMELAETLAVRAPAHLAHLWFMTGGAFSPRAQEFRRQHADRFIDKPFDIVAETARHLRDAGQRQEN